MKIIDVKSDDVLPKISRVGNDCIVNLDEQEVLLEDSIGFSYTGVFIPDAISYSEDDLVVIASKALKKMKLDSLVVTVGENVFDGNDQARINMLSAISGSELSGISEIPWKMADNSVVIITLAELKEALLLSIQEVGKIVGAVE